MGGGFTPQSCVTTYQSSTVSQEERTVVGKMGWNVLLRFVGTGGTDDCETGAVMLLGHRAQSLDTPSQADMDTRTIQRLKFKLTIYDV